jgi:hypothetical protein
MKKQVMVSPEVQKRLAHFELAYVDMDAPQSEELWDRLGIKELPWIGFLRPDGTLLEGRFMLREEVSVKQLTEHLDAVRAATR